jgi:carbonic anhydrase
MEGEHSGFIRSLTEEIRLAIGSETDPDEACRLNVERSVSEIHRHLMEDLHEDVEVRGAIYDIHTGRDDFDLPLWQP